MPDPRGPGSNENMERRDPSVTAAEELSGENFGWVVLVFGRQGYHEHQAYAYGPYYDEELLSDLASAAATGGAPTFVVDCDQRTVERYYGAQQVEIELRESEARERGG